MVPTKTALSVLKKIKKQHVRPRARWRFVLQRIAILIGALAFLVFGVFAAAATIHAIHVLGMPEMMHGPGPRAIVKLLILSLPIFWIGVFAALWWLTNFFVRRAEKAYKIPIWVLMISLLLVQICAGAALHRHVVISRMERMAAQHVPFYRGVDQTREKIWRHPEMGMLAGEILKVSDDQILILEDFSEKIWKVDFSAARVRPGTKMAVKSKIRMMGEPLSEDEFLAKRISNWEEMSPPRARDRRPPNPRTRTPR